MLDTMNVITPDGEIFTVQVTSRDVLAVSNAKGVKWEIHGNLPSQRVAKFERATIRTRYPAILFSFSRRRDSAPRYRLVISAIITPISQLRAAGIYERSLCMRAA